MKRSIILAGVTAAATTAALASAPATAAAPVVSDPIAEGLVTPLQLDIHNGKIYVAQSFMGVISRVKADGSLKNLVMEKGGAAIGGVSASKKKIAYTINDDGDEQNPKQRSALKIRRADGTTRKVADLQKFEETRNPDQVNSYGFQGLDAECAAQVPEEVGGAPYSGISDTNPYALAKRPGGGWYVADAGANAILSVTPKGKVRTVAVVPPRPTVITAEAASTLGLPECTVGETYNFEPVPTDVEVAPKGKLFVTLLPGGPEDPSLGNRGAVVSVNPDTKAVATVFEGLMSPTNLALGPKNTIYVTEMFAGWITEIKGKNATLVAERPLPGAVEWYDGKLYATLDVLNEEVGGYLVSITP